MAYSPPTSAQVRALLGLTAPDVTALKALVAGPAVATSYTVALMSSTAIVGGTVNVTATPVGGGWPAGETLSPALGGIAGTFSPQQATPTAGSTAAVSFALTPTAAGTGTVTVGASPSMGTAAGVQLTVSAAAAQPVAPGQVTQFVAGVPAQTSVPVTYVAPTAGTAPITYAGLTQVGSAVAIANGGTFTATGGTFTGMTAGTAYTLIVKATNSAGSSTTVLSGTVTTAAAQSAPAPVSTTPTTLSSFAGAAGTQPTGASAIAFRANGGSANGSANDGNGGFNLKSGTGAFAMFEGLGPLADGAYTFTLAAPGRLGLIWGASGGAAINCYFTDVGNGNSGVAVYFGYFTNGAYGGGTNLGGNALYPTATNWTLLIAGTTFTMFADGAQAMQVTDTRFAGSGSIGFRSVNQSTDTLTVKSLTYQTTAQFQAAKDAAAYAAAQAKVGTPTGAGVYGEAAPADGLARGIYGPAAIKVPYGLSTNQTPLASYFVRGMTGVTRTTLTGTDAGLFYLAPGNVLTGTGGLYQNPIGSVRNLNVVFDNSPSGGTDILTLAVTVPVIDGSVGAAYAGGIHICDGQDGTTFNGKSFLNGLTPAANSSLGITGPDAALFQWDYYGGIDTTAAAQPYSAHYGGHAVQFTAAGLTASDPVNLYILGQQSPRVKINYAPVWDNSDPGDVAFQVAACSELSSFVYTLFGPAAALFVVSNTGAGTLRPGATLAGKGGQSIAGVLRVTSHGASTYAQITVPVAAGTALPASNMTAVVATNLKNWVANQNTTARRAVTPSVSGMPGPVTWSLSQNNICYEDADPNSTYGLRHHRYVQNADGSVDALAQLSTQTDTLTLKARSGGTVCTNQFDVMVTSVPETIVYIGRGMRAAHGAVGFDSMGEATDLHKNGQSGWQFPHFMLMGDADPTYYDNDVGTSRYDLPGPTTWEGVAVNGHFPRVGGFWNTGKYGGIATGEKGFLTVNEGDHTFRNIEFSHIFGTKWGGFGQAHSTGGMAIRGEGNSRGNLTIDNCYFHDIDQPVEVGGTTGNVTITNSTFENYTGAYQGSGAMHGNYIGNCWQLTVDNCLYHRGWNGHLLKSRAWHSKITNSRFYDGTSGGASNQIDLCDAGISEVAHNVLHAFRKQNFASLQFGEEMRSGPRGTNHLNSHDNLFISNYPANISQTAISARTIIDPITGEQGTASSTNDKFYGYGPVVPDHLPTAFNGYDYNPNYTYGTSQDVSAFNQAFSLVNPTYLTSQPALDYTPAHNFVGFVTKPGPGYYPYSGEGSAKGWFNIDGVLIMPGSLELSVPATANGAVFDTPTVTGCLEADNDPTQPSPNRNPFADGNNTWQLRTDIQSYLGAAFTYPVAPAGMFTIDAQTGALTYHGGAAAGTTQYVGRECKNNTNGTVAWDYQYIRVTA